jgi:hypothetical protein
VSWLWPGYIGSGRLTLLDGDPGVGKSLVTLDLMARLTSGREFPDGSRPGAARAAVVLSGEDDLAETLRPRLLAAGADLGRVHAWDVGAGLAQFPRDCPELQELIQATGAGLVILDPFFAFLGPDVAGLNDLMIRRALDPLARVAQATGAAVLLIRHLRKASAGEAIHRGLGSIAILGAARTALLVALDPDDPERRVLACSKSNLGSLAASLGFRITATAAGVARIDWQGPVPYAADELLAPQRPRGQAVPQALAFLREQLARGPRDRRGLLTEAGEAGISLRTLERAKALLGVASEQRREGGRNVWYWRLDQG